MDQELTTGTHKIDVYRFDTEIISENTVKFEVSNVISWDSISLRMTKDELKGLCDFINKYLENN